MTRDYDRIKEIDDLELVPYRDRRDGAQVDCRECKVVRRVKYYELPPKGVREGWGR